MAVDYDPGASEVNQLNRIKLMIAVAKANFAAGSTAQLAAGSTAQPAAIAQPAAQSAVGSTAQLATTAQLAAGSTAQLAAATPALAGSEALSNSDSALDPNSQTLEIEIPTAEPAPAAVG